MKHKIANLNNRTIQQKKKKKRRKKKKSKKKKSLKQEPVTTKVLPIHNVRRLTDGSRIFLTPYP